MSKEQKSLFIQRLFEGLAPRYDLFNRLSSLGLVAFWYRRLQKEAAFSSHARVLDLCTGTGELALGTRRKLKNGAMIVGLDFSKAMLECARSKAQARGLESSWVDGSAAQIPFKNDTFDGVTMGFAMRNMESTRATLLEIHRALKVGGQALILELGRPHNPVFRRMHHAWLMTYVKVVGFFLRGKKEPFDYLARSIYEFLDPKTFLEEFSACGFTHNRYIPLTNGIAGIYVAVKK